VAATAAQRFQIPVVVAHKILRSVLCSNADFHVNVRHVRVSVQTSFRCLFHKRATRQYVSSGASPLHSWCLRVIIDGTAEECGALVTSDRILEGANETDRYKVTVIHDGKVGLPIVHDGFVSDPGHR